MAYNYPWQLLISNFSIYLLTLHVSLILCVEGRNVMIARQNFTSNTMWQYFFLITLFSLLGNVQYLLVIVVLRPPLHSFLLSSSPWTFSSSLSPAYIPHTCYSLNQNQTTRRTIFCFTVFLYYSIYNQLYFENIYFCKI